MARILLLTPQLPYPAQQGTSLRNLHIVKGLSLRHDLSLLSFATPAYQSDGEAYQTLSQFCETVSAVPAPNRSSWQRLTRLVREPVPDMAHRLRSRAYMRALSGLLMSALEEDRPYTIVQIEGIELVHLIQKIRLDSPTSRIVFDEHNAESELQLRAALIDRSHPARWPAALYSLLQARRLRWYERWACQSVEAVTVVSEADRRHLGELAPDIEITIIPNCIDLDDYPESSRSADLSYDIVFSGKMDYRPNVDAVLWFASEIWPRVVQARPGTTFAIVGQSPHKRLERIRAIQGITLTGFVPRIQPFLASCELFVMPFRVGSGTRIKLLEAMASGVPIVSTSVGVEGYDVTDGRELLIEDSPENFARAVVELLERPETRRRFSMAAKEFAKQYDYRLIIPRFDQVYDRL